MIDRVTRQRGFALLIVLWTLAILALLGTHLMGVARGETQLARNLLDAAELDAAANGAVQQAMYGLLDRSGHHWNADASTHFLTVGRAVVAVQVESETDKVNPNIASVALLQALAKIVGADPGMAADVANAIAARRLTGAFSMGQDAKPAEQNDIAPRAEFTSIDDLANVPRMTSALLSRLRPHMTIFTDDDPSPGTRDPVVAQALVAAGEGGGPSGGNPDIVSVFADARLPGNARHSLHVVVRLSAPSERPHYDILSVERPADRQ